MKTNNFTIAVTGDIYIPAAADVSCLLAMKLATKSRRHEGKNNKNTFVP